MDLSNARHLAAAGMLFIPAETPAASRPPGKRVDVARLHAEMADSLRTPRSSVPVPTVVIAPAHLFDDVWRALNHGTWSDRLKDGYTCLHRDGEIQFVPKA